MPPRFTYWTIIAGGLPTAFRAADRDEIMPTFQRLREKHPDAVLKWFARGKLWESPEEARASQERQRQSFDRRSNRRTGFTDRDPRRQDAGSPPEEHKRDRDWRPGGDHRDPRKKFADAKKARNAAHRQQRFERKHGAPRSRHGSASPERNSRPSGPAQRNSRPSGPAQGDQRKSERRPRPHGTKPFHSGTGSTGRSHGTGTGRPPGARAFERPGFERKRESRTPEPQSRDKQNPPSSPSGHERPKGPRHGNQRGGRFRRS